MLEKQLYVINKLGLHARAAAKLVGCASRFSSKITLDKQGKTADAKSIMAVMMLAASKGTTLDVHLDGDDEIEAYNALQQLFNNRFDEEE